MSSAFFKCVERTCRWAKIPEYATYKAVFGHYYRKGREVLIKLALENGISERPYSEPTYILADKLVKISKVEKQ